MGPLYLLFFLFIVTFLVHKPFNIHNAKQVWIIRLHHILEQSVWVQFLIVVNRLFR